MQTSANSERLRAAVRIAWLARSASSVEFGSPVSASRVVSCSMRASACLRAVTSAPVPRQPTSLPAASRTGTPLTDCQITPPDLVIIRCSRSRNGSPSAARPASHSSTARGSPSGMKSRGLRPSSSARG